MKRLILPCRRGVSTVTSVFMLLLMFTIIIAVFLAYFQYNLAMAEQHRIEQERSQEKIILSKLQIDSQSGRITSVTVNNTGNIEVRIRAIYETLNGETQLLFDPADYMDTHIAPGKSLTIQFPSEIEILFDPQAKIVAATERGIKTLDYEPMLFFGPITPPAQYDPTKLYIGPLMLKFDDFQYHKTTMNGELDPKDSWHFGWSIPKGFGYCAWKISVMNIDDKNITINCFSSFNVVPSESPSTTVSWYLNATDPINRTQFLQVNETRSIVYIWSGPELGVKAQQMNLPETTCMVFLTFFGVFHEHDGTETPYAQTIPFEASITVVG